MRVPISKTRWTLIGAAALAVAIMAIGVLWLGGEAIRFEVNDPDYRFSGSRVESGKGFRLSYGNPLLGGVNSVLGKLHVRTIGEAQSVKVSMEGNGTAVVVRSEWVGYAAAPSDLEKAFEFAAEIAVPGREPESVQVRVCRIDSRYQNTLVILLPRAAADDRDAELRLLDGVDHHLIAKARLP